jgi:hypothetical protein
MWTWLKKWGWALLGFVAVLLGAGWLWDRKAGELGRAKDKLAVAQAKHRIAELRMVREQLTERLGENDQAIEQLDRQLLDNKRLLVRAYEHGEDLSDAEIEEAFERLLSR